MSPMRSSPEINGGKMTQDGQDPGYRRRSSDGIIGQIRHLWPVIAAVAVGYSAWDGVKTKTYENSSSIEDVKKDVDTLKQGMAAQMAILTRVETSVNGIERGLRRRYKEDGP